MPSCAKLSHQECLQRPDCKWIPGKGCRKTTYLDPRKENKKQQHAGGSNSGVDSQEAEHHHDQRTRHHSSSHRRESHRRESHRRESHHLANGDSDAVVGPPPLAAASPSFEAGPLLPPGGAAPASYYSSGGSPLAPGDAGADAREAAYPYPNSSARPLVRFNSPPYPVPQASDDGADARPYVQVLSPAPPASLVASQSAASPAATWDATPSPSPLAARSAAGEGGGAGSSRHGNGNSHHNSNGNHNSRHNSNIGLATLINGGSQGNNDLALAKAFLDRWFAQFYHRPFGPFQDSQLLELVAGLIARKQSQGEVQAHLVAHPQGYQWKARANVSAAAAAALPAAAATSATAHRGAAASASGSASGNRSGGGNGANGESLSAPSAATTLQQHQNAAAGAGAGAGACARAHMDGVLASLAERVEARYRLGLGRAQLQNYLLQVAKYLGSNSDMRYKPDYDAFVKLWARATGHEAHKAMLDICSEFTWAISHSLLLSHGGGGGDR
jgi:hypothetical protein